MDKSIRFYDAGAEGFYHGLVLGLIALMDNQYKIKSNRESGDGRYDISLFPREGRYPGIIPLNESIAVTIFTVCFLLIFTDFRYLFCVIH